jgi:hypothetical protein
MRFAAGYNRILQTNLHHSSLRMPVFSHDCVLSSTDRQMHRARAERRHLYSGVWANARGACSGGDSSELKIVFVAGFLSAMRERCVSRYATKSFAFQAGARKSRTRFARSESWLFDGAGQYKLLLFVIACSQFP